MRRSVSTVKIFLVVKAPRQCREASSSSDSTATVSPPFIIHPESFSLPANFLSVWLSRCLAAAARQYGNVTPLTISPSHLNEGHLVKPKKGMMDWCLFF